MAVTIERLDHFVLNVTDVEEAAAWYQRVLGFERTSFGPQGRTALRYGPHKINLRPHNLTQEEWFAAHDCSPGTHDVAFVTSATPEEVAAHLTAQGVQIVRGPIDTHGALGPIRSVYCRDPDGNLIEFAHYPNR